MTIQPDTLYDLCNKNIIDYVPNDIFYMPVNKQYCTYQPAYDPNYLDNAKKGYAYQYDGIDTFVSTSPVSVNNYDRTPLDDLKEYFRIENNKLKCAPLSIKGLFAGGIIATTFALFVKKIKHK